MGLDTVELVMRCEETFGIEIPDDEAAQVRTVGHLYEFICKRLGLAALARPELTVGTSRLPRGVLGLAGTAKEPWNARDVWSTLVAIFVDQLGVEPEEVTYEARIRNDLGCD